MSETLLAIRGGMIIVSSIILPETTTQSPLMFFYIFNTLARTRKSINTSERYMKFRRTNVLVVGGEGFIGKNLRSIYKPKIRWHNLDLKSKQDVLDGIHKKYDAIVWLACNFTESE